MLIIDIPVNPRSTQTIELDENGIDYIFELRWIPEYQRFYIYINDAQNNPIVEGVKLVPGAPINLANVSPNGPQGVFILYGSGDTTRRALNDGGYTLYYLPRETVKFPLVRSYTIDTDLNQFLLGVVGGVVGGTPPEPEIPVPPNGPTFVVDTTITGAGTSASNQFQLPLSTSFSYAFEVDWGDGTKDFIASPLAPEALHTYSAGQEWSITISGVFPTMQFNGEGDAIKMVDWKNWREIQLSEGMFWGCSNLVFSSFDEFPVLGTSTQNAFRDCASITEINELESCNMSDVLEMEGMFWGCSLFNQDISDWNVSRTTSMRNMFRDCISYNTDLDFWVVGSLENAEGMFWGCTSFDANVETWKPRNLITARHMFRDCSIFNRDLNNWNVTSLTDAFGMFQGCSLLDQDFTDWDTTSLINAAFMFTGCEVFDGDVTTWNMSNVRDIAAMFLGCTVFNQDISPWDVSSVISAGGLFASTDFFNQNLNSWNTASLGTLEFMFQNATAYNQPMSNWSIALVEDMQYAFSGATSFNQDLSAWNTQAAINMEGMFFGASSFNQDISSFIIQNVTTMEFMLTDSGLSTTNYSNYLISCSNQGPNIKSNVELGAFPIQYSMGPAAAARASLISSNSWNIVDGGLAP